MFRSSRTNEPVMAGLGPAIHVFVATKQDVDARHKAGHDGGVYAPARHPRRGAGSGHLSPR
jgi:hypothetical protein